MLETSKGNFLNLYFEWKNVSGGEELKELEQSPVNPLKSLYSFAVR